MNNYLIYTVKSDIKDPQAVYSEIHSFVDWMLGIKESKTPAELYDELGPEVANWLVFTDLSTLQIDTAKTEDGKVLIGFHGDQLDIEPIF
jgi:hypothetical protein